MLAEVAEAAMVLAEAPTQPDGLLVAVDKVTDTAGAPAGHLSKKMTVETSEDGVRKTEQKTLRWTIRWRQQSWSETEGSRMVIDHNNDILQQVSMLCSTVQNLSRQMQ